MALRAEVPDEVRAHQDSGADAAEEQEQHPDGVEVGLNQPECADDQPEQDDQGHRSNVSAAHRSDTSGITLAAAPTCTRSAMTVHIAWWLCRRDTGIQLTGGAMGALAHVLAADPIPARSQMGSSLGF